MNEKDFTLLNDYFNGLLSAGDAQTVEARAATDAEFGEEFALRQDMEAYPRRAARHQEFADTLATVSTDFFQEISSETSENQPSMTARVSRTRWLMAAAAAIALVAVAVWFFTLPGTADYSQYAQHAPLSLTVRGTADQAASEAENAFNQKNYTAALAALDRLLAEQPDNLTAQLYKGISLIELNRTADARVVLGPMADGTSALRTEAMWYMALSYLKEKNAAACRAELSKIPPGDVRYEQAQELLKKLKQ